MGVGMLGLGLRAAGLAATLLGLGLLPVGTLVCLRHCADSRGNYAPLDACEPKHKGPETYEWPTKHRGPPAYETTTKYKDLVTYEMTTTCGELVLSDGPLSQAPKELFLRETLDTLSMRVYVNGSVAATGTMKATLEATLELVGSAGGVWPGATTALGASTLALVVGAGTVAALVVGEVDGGFLVFSLAVRALLLLIAALGALADAFQGTPTGQPLLLLTGLEGSQERPLPRDLSLLPVNVVRGFPLVLTWCVAGIFFLAGLGLAVVELFVPAREPTRTAQSTLSSLRPSEAPAAPPPTAPPPAYVCSQESLAAKGSNLQGSDTILPQAQQTGDPNAPAAQGQPQTPAQQTPGAPYPVRTQPPPPPQSMAPTQQPMTQPQQMAQPQPMIQPQPLQQMAEPREAQAPVSPAAAAAVGSGTGAELVAAEALPPTDAEVRPKKRKSKKGKKGKKAKPAPEVSSDDEPSNTETTRPSDTILPQAQQTGMRTISHLHLPHITPDPSSHTI